jgi:hypothetical protein
VRVMKPRIEALYESACAECSEAGAILTPSDYAWLYDAARRVVDFGSESPLLLEVPVKVGNVVLYPRTIGSGVWWDRNGQRWFGGGSGDADETVALAWSLSNARRPDVFEWASSKWKAEASILKWSLGVASRVTVGDLAWGIVRLFGQMDVVDISSPNAAKVEIPSSSESDWGTVVARLCATYHRPPEDFLWKMSDTAAVELFRKSPLPDGTHPGADADAAKRLGEFKEIVLHIKRRAKGGE